jgi:Ca2+-transporting ATPase
VLRRSGRTGTLTMNEQTVTEVYAVDEVLSVDGAGAHALSPAMRKVLEVGALCNNAVLSDAGAWVGQATDVALLNVLSAFDVSDPRQVRTASHYCISCHADVLGRPSGACPSGRSTRK